MRRTISTLTVLALVVVLALAAVACGSSGASDAASTQPAASPTLSAQQLVEQSLEATGKVKSASFTADLALKANGDTSQMDPTTQAMTDLSLHAQGKAASDPAATDMSVSVGIAGQTLEFAVKAQHGKAWVQYQGKWYVIDEKTAKSMGVQASPSAGATGQLKSLGLDPADLGATYEYVGAEDVGGTQAYHVKATVDPQKMAAALLKAVSDPAVLQQLGQNSAGKQLEKTLEQDKGQLRKLGKMLMDPTADFWIGAEDMLLRKVTVSMGADMTGEKSMQGVQSLNMTGAATLSGFGQPVTVTPPTDALPFSQLMNSLFGGMFGGMTSGASTTY